MKVRRGGRDAPGSEGGRTVYFGSQAGTWRDHSLLRVCISVGDSQHLPVRRSPSLHFSDVKMKIRGFFSHIQEHVIKPILEQNVDMGVFSLGDFWRFWH